MKKKMDLEKSLALEVHVEQEIAKTDAAIEKLKAMKGKPLELDGEMLEMLASNRDNPHLIGMDIRESLLELYAEKEINLMSMAILDRLAYMPDEEDPIH